MRAKHKEAWRVHAQQELKWCRIPLGEDFHCLTTAQKDALEQAADRVRYQRPRNANGSRLRYYHDLLQRRAKA